MFNKAKPAVWQQLDGPQQKQLEHVGIILIHKMYQNPEKWPLFYNPKLLRIFHVFLHIPWIQSESSISDN